MNYTVSDITITKGGRQYTVPGRTFDSSTIHDVMLYIQHEAVRILADTEQETADRVETEQADKLEDPVKAEGIDPPEEENDDEQETPEEETK